MSVKNPIIELEKTKLWKYLYEINKEYAQKSKVFVQKISPLLSSIHNHFPYYTRHDVHHGYEVLIRMEQIIDSNCLKKGSEIAFNSEETFLLICSAYSHDLGMTVFPGEAEKLCDKFELNDKDDWETDNDLQDFLREHHSRRGGKYILDHYKELVIPKKLIGFLNELMRSHNLSIHELEVQLDRRVATGEKEIDLKQLACILCIADALEFSDTRVIDGVLDNLEKRTEPRAQISYRENMKHICIGDNVAIGSDGKVIFSGSFEKPEVLNIAHKTVDLIENWVKQYCDIDYKSSKKRLKLRSDSFIRDFNIIGVDFERLGIRIKKENIINLISSNSTWSNDNSVPLRELLQNSVEACRYRQYNTPESRQYTPKIKVDFDRNNSSIIIEDNGCGMSKNIILNNFLTIGNSRANMEVYKSYGYNSLARFGIGFWSVFTIASEAVVETAPFELLNNKNISYKVSGYKFKVSIEKFKDYTVFKPLKRKVGTKIILKLKDDISMDDILIKLHNQIFCSKIPIEISTLEEKKYISKKPVPADYKEVFSAKRSIAHDSNVKLFKWKKQKSNLEASISLAYRIENGKATFLLEDGESSMLTLTGHNTSSKIGICGFKIQSRIEHLCFDIDRVGCYYINTLDPQDFEFRLDRHALLNSPKVKKFKIQLANFIHDGYREFLRKFNSYTPEYIYNLNMQSRLHGGNVYDKYTKDNLFIGSQNYSDLICFKLYKVEKNKELRNANINYITLDELLEMSVNIWTCQTSISHNFRSSAKGIHISAKQLLKTLYDYVLNKGNLKNDNYLLEPCVEGSMLYDNDSNAEIHIMDVNIPVSQTNYITDYTNIIKISTDTIVPSEEHNCVIAVILQFNPVKFISLNQYKIAKNTA
ncbi:HD domain-containing protein [Halanaerobium salsuginis]|uniref:Histidine kinase-, DNA gyrase B-, and HSP90-like ATPase n=1 Tax=Halanaerobium salsuginis TaxID=29563 RepID=A0A1I4NFU7_9FIRM|nr:ATP-binding protein [Halanaerobium salsuginis]SFM14371.1 Histidine kinase-, DNA gyrase B-, and HSP90-like ATPase [Halanaerobium salsuginis]